MEYSVEIDNILNTVKSKIDAHLKFKREYDKQLAFDFSLFQFFKVGENKISQILAYFLDEHQNHGQGNIFLKEFVKQFHDEKFQVKQLNNICELVITENRRLDIYIELENFTIAIENKIWADDQKNQLDNYAKFLEHRTKGNYLLLYLNPYGLEPTTKSISKQRKEKLIKQNKLNIISYKEDIIGLINSWLVICEADNVYHFLKEFKKYLEIKFLGKNTLNMSKELRTLIKNNEREVKHLVNEYKAIENEILSKLNDVGKDLDKINPELDAELNLSKSGLFNWNGARVYKYSISKGQNKIWIQFVKEEIHLISNYYLGKDTEILFNEILLDLKINQNNHIDYNQSKANLKNIFLGQVQIARQAFRIYEERKTSE